MINVNDLASGRWPGLLKAVGIPAELLTNKHVACPFCSKRHFRFTDRNHGDWICTCSYGDGFDLMKRLLGIQFKEASKQIRQLCGAVEVCAPIPEMSDEQKLKSCKRVWEESRRISKNDPAHRYLTRRGLTVPTNGNLRCHPGLKYKDEDGKVVGTFPVMLARVADPENNSVTLHRTYLTPDGAKAPVAKAKKLMPGKPVSGAAVRLFDPAATMGIAEGVETALAASKLFGVPVWSCISAHGLESWAPPAGVARVMVFGDNDASYTGQASAYVAAKKLRMAGIEVTVHIPTPEECDWADMLERRV